MSDLIGATMQIEIVACYRDLDTPVVGKWRKSGETWLYRREHGISHRWNVYVCSACQASPNLKPITIYT